MENAIQVVNIEDYAMTPEKIQNQVNIIQKVMQQVMKKDEHFGTIPGCGPKPTLLKSGAEKLCVTFRFAPSYDIRKTEFKDFHREYEVVCTLTHISSGLVVGQGVGSCSTLEGKFRFRTTERKCPLCGAESIIKGKAQYGGGWLCWAKKGGCGAKFKDGDNSIEGQEAGRADHDNPPDYYNTVLKMSKKRALVDGILTATAASDLFTQDIEDMSEVLPSMPKAEPKPSPEPAGSEPPTMKPPKEPKTPPKQNTVTTETGFPPAGPDATKEQYNAIFAIAQQNELTDRELNELANWYKQGEILSSKEASVMITDFKGVLESYLNYIESLK